MGKMLLVAFMVATLNACGGASGAAEVYCQKCSESRSLSPRYQFRKLNACPSTGKTKGACPGYEVDHTQSLILGGKDEPSNMQWLSIADHRAKTREDMKKARALKKANG